MTEKWLTRLPLIEVIGQNEVTKTELPARGAGKCSFWLGSHMPTLEFYYCGRKAEFNLEGNLCLLHRFLCFLRRPYKSTVMLPLAKYIYTLRESKF